MTASAARRRWTGQFLRYALVGVAATAAHWGLMAWLVAACGVSAWLASGAGGVLGAQLAFAGNRLLTFGHCGRWLPAWWRFMGTALAGTVLGMAVVAVLVAAGWWPLSAQAVATAIVLVLGFAVNRRWTFAGQ
jgi:putative flippase GtrA